MALPAIETFAGGASGLPNPPWNAETFVFYMARDGSGHGVINLTGSDAYDSWDADTFPNDQYAEVTLNWAPSGAGNDYVYLFVRGTYSGGIAQTGYWFWTDGVSDTAIIRVDAGVQTVIASNAATFANGDVFKAEAIGSALTLYKNGGVVLTTTDATYTAGQPALGGNSSDGAYSVVTFQADAASGGGGGGGVHSGLTGQGFITVSSPVGVQVDLTGIAGSAGAGPGYPMPRYGIGSIGFSNDAAHYDRLHFLSQPAEVFPCPFPATTSIAYSLAAGITATITEIAAW